MTRLKIDGCYTKMQRIANNTSWQQMTTDKGMYYVLKIKSSRTKSAGHCTASP